MGTLLPREHANPRAFSAIHLPNMLGGYELGAKEDLLKYWKASPKPHRFLLSKMMTGVGVERELTLLRRLNQTPTTRGIAEISEYESDLSNMITGLSSMFGGISWPEFREKFSQPGFSARRTIGQGFRHGWMSASDFAAHVTRGTLFQKLIMAEPDEVKNFSTRPWVETYNRMWDELMDLLLPYGEPDWDLLNNKNTWNLLYSCNKIVYIDSNQKRLFDVGQEADPNKGTDETYWYFSERFLRGFRTGFPDLSVGNRFVGWKGPVRNNGPQDFFVERDIDPEEEVPSLINQLVTADNSQLEELNKVPGPVGLESSSDEISEDEDDNDLVAEFSARQAIAFLGEKADFYISLLREQECSWALLQEVVLEHDVLSDEDEDSDLLIFEFYSKC